MNNILPRIRKVLKSHELIPTKPLHSDLYIVEYPKSGITWLSTLLANSALISSKRPERATFLSARLYVPDIHLNRDLGYPAYTTPPQRMIKSHSLHNNHYLFVLYLTRHPFSVMESFYKYLIAQEVKLPSFEEFIFLPRYGLPAWKKHINSWLNGPITGKPIHLIRYEDLLSDPSLEIRKISKNFGWNLSSDAINQAVQISTKHFMSEQEKFYLSHNPRHNMHFVGSSMEIYASEQLRNQLYERVLKDCSGELRLLGYL